VLLIYTDDVQPTFIFLNKRYSDVFTHTDITDIDRHPGKHRLIYRKKPQCNCDVCCYYYDIVT
jgi:hypothetical protein